MTDTRLLAAMLRAVLNLEHWPTDLLARELGRWLEIAGLELAPAGACATLADVLTAEPAPAPVFDLYHHRDDGLTERVGARVMIGDTVALADDTWLAVCPPSPAPRRFEDGSTLELDTLTAHPPPDPRVEMDARTRRVSAGLEAPPPGVPTTFAAVPDAKLPRCPVCSHLEHGSAVCGARVPLTWSDSIDARVPDTCQCEGEPPAPALEAPERFPDHMDETCRLGRDTDAIGHVDATLRRYGHRVFIDIGLDGVGATLELDRFHIAGAVALLTEAQRQ